MPSIPVVPTPVPEQTEARKKKADEKPVERVIDTSRVRSVILTTKFRNLSETCSTSGRSVGTYPIILLIIDFTSEREHDDWEDDPSLHPTQTTMFMEKSKSAIQNGLSRKKSQMHLAGSQSIGDFTTLKKASSCSTIYIDDSTVSQPNLKNTIKCVSLAIYYHIKNRNSDTILDIFDEKKQPLTVRL